MGIKVEKLTKVKSKFRLEDISFALPAGYILGVIGRNGSGKSTLFQSLLFGDNSDGGAVTVYGKAADSADDARVEYRKQFAYVLEDCPFPDYFTAKELGEALGTFYDGFHADKYKKWLKTMQIPEKKRICSMSQGTKLKLQIAFAFSYDSKVLLLDEPTASLDSFARKDLYRMIFEYMEDGDHSVIWTTHLTDELDRMADYLLYLENGRQVFFEEKEALLSKYRVVKGSKGRIDCMANYLLGRSDFETYSEGLVMASDAPFPMADTVEQATIEQLLVYFSGSDKKKINRQGGQSV